MDLKGVAVDIRKFCNEELHTSSMCEVKDDMRHCFVISGSYNDSVPVNVLMIVSWNGKKYR